MKIRLIAALLGWGIVTSPSLSLAQQAGNGPPVPVVQPVPQAPIITGRMVTPMDFGAVGDGVTNDTTAVQNAINTVTAAGGNHTLYLGGHSYCVSGLVLNAPIRIVGSNKTFQSNGSPGFTQCVQNNPVLTIQPGANGSVLEDFVINGSTTLSTSGAEIINQAGSTLISQVTINNPCVGIEDDGNNNIYSGITISGSRSDSNSCGGFWVGRTTTNESTIDVRITNSVLPLTGYQFGIQLQDSGGAYIYNNDILFSQYGTLVDPGANQFTDWTFASNTVLGDSVLYNGLLMSPGASSAQIRGFFCDQCWVGSVGKSGSSFINEPGIVLQNPNGGNFVGAHFTSLRAFSVGGTGFVVGPNVADVVLNDSALCGLNLSNSTNVFGAEINGGAAVHIQNNRIAFGCNGTRGNPLTAAILIQGGSLTGPLMVVGNDLSGNTTPISVASAFSATQMAIIEHNLPYPNGLTTVTAAATITAPIQSIFALSGTTTISTINGYWLDRRITMIDTQGAALSTTGGNIAAVPASFTANQTIECYWSGASWYCH
jgi:hypothetical protein